MLQFSADFESLVILMQESTSQCSFALIVPSDPHNSSHRQNKSEGRNDIKTKDKSGTPEQVEKESEQATKIQMKA